MEASQFMEAASWVGRQQAFAVIASKCTAAQAECLREIRESRAHNQLNLTWEEFCLQHAGISRRYADELIRRLDEFGESYFKLSQLARVSPETYRRIAGQIRDDVIEIGGKEFELVPENAAPIRAAILRLQNHPRETSDPEPKPPTLNELQARLETLIADFFESAERRLTAAELASFRGMCGLCHQ